MKHATNHRAGYARARLTARPPLDLQTLALLMSGAQAASAVLERTFKGGRIYNRFPKLVADVNRVGKRFVAALHKVMEAASRAPAGNGRPGRR